MTVSPSTFSSDEMSLAEAQQLLRQFDCDRPVPALEVPQVRSALHQVAHHSDYQILGICANTLEEGIRALSSYATALGYRVDPSSLSAMDGAVYLKFNPKTGLLYSDRYSGEYRGVLVSCQSAYENGVNEMYGHLPLTLFTEG